MQRYSTRILEIKPFEVMEIVSKAKELQHKGFDVIRLEIGEPDLNLEDELIEEIKKIKRVYYTESEGRKDLREKISNRVRDQCRVEISMENVIVTGGTSLGFLYIFGTILEEGDHVIIFRPYYPCYPNFVRFFKAREVYVDLKDYVKIDEEKLLEALNKKVKALIINTPCNPTGKFFNRKCLKLIADIAEDYNLYVISDEIYSRLTFNVNRSPSMLEFLNLDKAILLDGFSKLFSMSGLRIGYIVADKQLIREFSKIQQNFYISPSSLSQEVALKALDIEEKIREKAIKVYRERLEIVKEYLKKIGIRYIEPDAAFYVFCSIKDSKEFCKRLLLEKYVSLTPGEAFGVRNSFRISYVTDKNRLRVAMERIKEFLEENPRFLM